MHPTTTQRGTVWARWGWEGRSKRRGFRIARTTTTGAPRKPRSLSLSLFYLSLCVPNSGGSRASFSTVDGERHHVCSHPFTAPLIGPEPRGGVRAKPTANPASSARSAVELKLGHRWRCIWLGPGLGFAECTARGVFSLAVGPHDRGIGVSSILPGPVCVYTIIARQSTPDFSIFPSFFSGTSLCTLASSKIPKVPPHGPITTVEPPGTPPPPRRPELPISAGTMLHAFLFRRPPPLAAFAPLPSSPPISSSLFPPLSSLSSSFLHCSACSQLPSPPRRCRVPDTL